MRSTWTCSVFGAYQPDVVRITRLAEDNFLHLVLDFTCMLHRADHGTLGHGLKDEVLDLGWDGNLGAVDGVIVNLATSSIELPALGNLISQ